MADHFVALNRGQQGFTPSDFTTGTSAAGGSTIEIRVPDGASMTRKDIITAILAFERFFENKDLTAAAGIVFTI